MALLRVVSKHLHGVVDILSDFTDVLAWAHSEVAYAV